MREKSNFIFSLVLILFSFPFFHFPSNQTEIKRKQNEKKFGIVKYLDNYKKEMIDIFFIK